MARRFLRGSRGDARPAAADAQDAADAKAAAAERHRQPTAPTVPTARTTTSRSSRTRPPTVRTARGRTTCSRTAAQPDGFPVKGNANSRKYHTPESPYYDATIAEVWFATAEAAEAAGFDAVATDPGAAEDES